MRLRVFLPAVIFMLLSLSQVYATHIVGGSLSVVHVSGNNYRIELKVLRDCFNGQADFDRPAYIGMFDKVTHNQVQVISMNNPQISELTFTGPNCTGNPSACTELGFYQKTVSFNPTVYNSTSGYYFVYMRCCRNNIIQNITQPGDAGIAIYTEVPRFALQNSTPTFSNNPHTYLCTNNIFNYNFNFTDADGDQLVYSLVTPLNGTLTPNRPVSNNPDPGPYDDINWKAGYNKDVQIQGSPGLAINATTGEIEMNPSASGVYVAAIKVEELRFGQKIGEVRLELQFHIVTCPSNATPDIQFKNLQGQWINPLINVEVPNSLCFDIVVEDPSDSVYVKITGGAFSDTLLAIRPTLSDSVPFGDKRATARFCWDTRCELAGTQKKFTVEAIDNGCPMPKKARSSFTVNITPMPLIHSVDLLCMHLLENQVRFDYGDSVGDHPYFSKYYVYRSIAPDTFVKIDSIDDKSIRNYLDPNAPDNRLKDYRYFIRAANLCGVEGPTSDTSSSFENLEVIPRQQEIITVTVEENKFLKIIWPKTHEQDFARYTIYKTQRGSTDWKQFREFVNFNDTVIQDLEVDVANTSYCYHVVMRDTCENVGPEGKMACSIVLNGVSEPFAHTVEWLSYNYWATGTQKYEIFRDDHLNPFALTATAKPVNLDFKDEELNTKSGLYHYYVVAKQDVGDNSIYGKSYFGATSRSNTIELIQAPLLYVPNAFTPNNDGMNDVLGIRDVFVKEYSLQIYNRWGQVIFSTTDKNVQWDGKNSEGIDMQEDVYVYLVTYTGWDNSFHRLKGNITLLH